MLFIFSDKTTKCIKISTGVSRVLYLFFMFVDSCCNNAMLFVIFISKSLLFSVVELIVSAIADMSSFLISSSVFGVVVGHCSQSVCCGFGSEEKSSNC
jgi:succinate-acetate transporter protein